jgi:molybdopterin-guanine dinucleotide biosynthesis protein B
VKVIAVVGTKKSGKTTVTTFLIRSLTEEGYKVAAIKHIHHGFTMDTRGKDTWQFARAGAKLVVSVAPGEVATLRKVGRQDVRLEPLFAEAQSAGVEMLFLEGFREQLGARSDIPKIVTANNARELRTVMTHLQGPIIAVSGVIANRRAGRRQSSLPVVDVRRHGDVLVALVKQQFRAPSR